MKKHLLVLAATIASGAYMGCSDHKPTPNPRPPGFVPVSALTTQLTQVVVTPTAGAQSISIDSGGYPISAIVTFSGPSGGGTYKAYFEAGSLASIRSNGTIFLDQGAVSVAGMEPSKVEWVETERVMAGAEGSGITVRIDESVFPSDHLVFFDQGSAAHLKQKCIVPPPPVDWNDKQIYYKIDVTCGATAKPKSALTGTALGTWITDFWTRGAAVGVGPAAP